MSTMDISLMVPPYSNCTECNKQLFSEDAAELIEIHFSTGKCPHCNKKIDGWKMILKYLNENPLKKTFNVILPLVGFKSKIICGLDVKPQCFAEIDLTDYGVPESSEIFLVNITLHGNNGRPLLSHGTSIPTELSLVLKVFGVPRQNRNSNKHTKELIKFDILVIYSNKEEFDLPSIYIYFGGQSLINKSLEKFIIYCSIASEILVSEICEVFWEKYFNKDKIKNFNAEFNYIQKLRCHLVLAGNSVEEKELEKPIKRSLAKLNEYRNQVVHIGKFKDEITLEQTNELFASVLFLRGYCMRLMNRLKEN